MKLLSLSLAFSAVAIFGATQFAEGQELSDELKDMEWIGFQQFEDASRVFVRTTEPVRYNVDTTRPDAVEVILENTRIPLRNNQRPLPTQYFDTPIMQIRATAIEGPSPSVRLEILLRKKVPFEERQSDNVLMFDFERI